MLWMTFKEILIENMQEIKENESENKALQQIDKFLRENGLDYGSFSHPTPKSVQINYWGAVKFRCS